MQSIRRCSLIGLLTRIPFFCLLPLSLHRHSIGKCLHDIDMMELDTAARLLSHNPSNQDIVSRAGGMLDSSDSASAAHFASMMHVFSTCLSAMKALHSVPLVQVEERDGSDAETQCPLNEMLKMVTNAFQDGLQRTALRALGLWVYAIPQVAAVWLPGCGVEGVDGSQVPNEWVRIAREVMARKKTEEGSAYYKRGADDVPSEYSVHKQRMHDVLPVSLLSIPGEVKVYLLDLVLAGEGRVDWLFPVLHLTVCEAVQLQFVQRVLGAEGLR